MKDRLTTKITELWHISRTALAGMTTVPSRWDRMQYVANELRRSYPALIKGMSSKIVWLEIEKAIEVY